MSIFYSGKERAMKQISLLMLLLSGRYVSWSALSRDTSDEEEEQKCIIKRFIGENVILHRNILTVRNCRYYCIACMSMMCEQRMKLNAHVKWQSRKLIALWSILRSHSVLQLLIPFALPDLIILPVYFETPLQKAPISYVQISNTDYI